MYLSDFGKFDTKKYKKCRLYSVLCLQIELLKLSSRKFLQEI